MQRLTPRLAVREFGPSLLLLLVCLIGADLFLSTDTMYELLPLAKPYYSYDVTRRVHHLERLRSKGPVDVVFVGTSIVRADFDPKVFDKRLKRNGIKITSFNAGLSAMYPPGAKLYLEHLWLDAAQPRYVLHGLRESELVLSSPTAGFLKGMLDRKWDEGTRWALFEAEVIQHVQLTQYRGALRRMIARWRDGKPLHATERGELTTDSRGHRKEPISLTDNRKRRNRRLWKYSAAPVANRYRHALPALEAMNELSKQAGATYVIVNMPEHAERFTKKYGRATWDDYQKRVRDWAQTHGVPYLDVSNGDPQTFSDDKYYSDFHHMSQRGAEHFSTKLAEQFAKLVKEQEQKKP